MSYFGERSSHQPVRCPHCGRPFVDIEAARMHVVMCAAARQRELDAEWQREQARRQGKPDGECIAVRTW